MSTQVMAVSAIQDGNGNVHPLAISDFSAAEGTMTSESHCKADVTLNPQNTYHGQLTVVDGAPVLSEAVTKYYNNMSLARCRRHYRERLLTTAHGRRDLQVYDDIVVVPRTQRALADRLYQKLPKDSPIHEVPREHLCDAYLPEGVDSHSVKLNNSAEQWNFMSMAAREEESKFRSMQAVVGLLEARQQSLSGLVHREKAKNAPPGTSDSALAQMPWSETASIPRMEQMNELQRVRSLGIAEPTECVGASEGSEVHLVQSERNPKVTFRVNLVAMEQRRYQEACSCGMSSSGLVRAALLPPT